MDQEEITISIKHGAKMHTIKIDANATLQTLREELHKQTDVLPALQKIMYKGTLSENDKTLKELKVTNGAKLMMMGTKIENVLAASEAAEKAAAAPTESDLDKAEPEIEDPNEAKEHQHALKDGPPSDAVPAIVGKNESIPPLGIKGTRDKMGTSLRLQLKTDVDQLWIATPSSTQKVSFGSITEIKTWKIKNHDGYHVACFLMGKTSKYWVYWIPDQYMKALRGTILGWNI